MWDRILRGVPQAGSKEESMDEEGGGTNEGGEKLFLACECQNHRDQLAILINVKSKVKKTFN